MLWLKYSPVICFLPMDKINIRTKLINRDITVNDDCRKNLWQLYSDEFALRKLVTTIGITSEGET